MFFGQCVILTDIGATIVNSLDLYRRIMSLTVANVMINRDRLEKWLTGQETVLSPRPCMALLTIMVYCLSQ